MSKHKYIRQLNNGLYVLCTEVVSGKPEHRESWSKTGAHVMVEKRIFASKTLAEVKAYIDLYDLVDYIELNDSSMIILDRKSYLAGLEEAPRRPKANPTQKIPRSL
jgi:hypothetical protein